VFLGDGGREGKRIIVKDKESKSGRRYIEEERCLG